MAQVFCKTGKSMPPRTHLILIGTIVLLLAAGCVEKKRRLSPADRARLKALVSHTAPTPKQKLNVKFEDKVRLLGYDLDTPVVNSNEPFKVTWYWKVEKDLDEGWLLFTHLADAENVSRINVDSERAIRRLHPAEEWKAGEYIRDPQEITLPSNWTSPEVRFYVGLWNGPHRMHITKGPDDGEHRVLALKIPVASLPQLLVPAVAGPLEIDGKLDEPQWQKAAKVSPFSDPRTNAKGAVDASARVMHDQERLYVAFEVADSYVKSSFQNRDDHLWEQDAVEIMADPGGDGKGYFEIQVSPLGVVFDTRYDTPRVPKPFGHKDWDSQAVAKAVVDGTPNDEEADKGYVVEVAVPWQSFSGEPSTEKEPGVPQGPAWRMNFFVMDALEKGQRAVAWSPPMVPDFHTLNRFGQVAFSSQPATATAPKEATAAAPAATATAPKEATAAATAATATAPKEATAAAPATPTSEPAATAAPKSAPDSPKPGKSKVEQPKPGAPKPEQPKASAPTEKPPAVANAPAKSEP